MSLFLIIAYLFFLGSIFGWILELFYRKFISAVNPERKWINPGFCVGPYVPLYGFGLVILYLLAKIGKDSGFDATVLSHIILFAIMAIFMTVIEYIAGIIGVRFLKVRLWDYSKEWGNIQGIICPKFSMYWSILGAVYYFLIHPHILHALEWLSQNLAFSFVIGFFFGVFTIDVTYSANLVAKLRKFAIDNEIIIRYEHLKAHIGRIHERYELKSNFILPFSSKKFSLHELLVDAYEVVEDIKEKISIELGGNTEDENHDEEEK